MLISHIIVGIVCLIVGFVARGLSKTKAILSQLDVEIKDATDSANAFIKVGKSDLAKAKSDLATALVNIKARF